MRIRQESSTMAKLAFDDFPGQRVGRQHEKTRARALKTRPRQARPIHFQLT